MTYTRVNFIKRGNSSELKRIVENTREHVALPKLYHKRSDVPEKTLLTQLPTSLISILRRVEWKVEHLDSPHLPYDT